MRKIFFALLCLGAVAMTACEKDPKEPAAINVTGVSLNAATLSLEIGGTQTLAATIAPANATNGNVSWTSSTPAVATVDQSGKVSAVSAGTTTITVTTEDGKKTATCAVTVNAAQQEDPKSALEETFAIPDAVYTEAAVPAGTTDEHTATAAISNSKVTVVSDVELEEFYVGVKGVDGHYVVAATPATRTAAFSMATTRAEGDFTYVIELAMGDAVTENQTVVISAKVKDSDAVVALEELPVTPSGDQPAADPIAVESVSVAPTTATLAIGASQQLTATVLPADAENKTVAWGSSDDAVATVSNSGLVTAIAAGSATITATTTDGAKTASATITVSPAAGTFALTLTADASMGEAVAGEADLTAIAEGTDVYITATPADGFAFVEWTVVSGDVIFNDAEEAETYFTMPAGDVEIAATFEADSSDDDDEPVVTGEYTLSATATNGKVVFTVGGSTASGADEAASVTATATPNAGYKFTGWTSSDITIAEGDEATSPLTFDMPAANVALTATFAAIEYTVAAAPASGANGSAVIDDADGKATIGTSVKFTATSQAGYVFDKWTATGYTFADAQATTNPLTISMPAANVELTATFKKQTYAIDLSGATGVTLKAGSATPAEAGATITLTVAPAAGKELKTLTVTGSTTGAATLSPTVSAATLEYTFTMPAEAVIVAATYDDIAYTVAAATSTGDDTQGSAAVSGDTDGKAVKGASLTFTATPETGYAFVKWTATGITLSAEDAAKATLAVTMPAADVKLTATFAATYAIDVTAGAADADNNTFALTSGSTSPSVAGKVISLTATPNTGFHLVSFTVTNDGGGTTAVSIDAANANVGTFTMPAAAVVVTATFAADEPADGGTGEEPVEGGEE